MTPLRYASPHHERTYRGITRNKGYPSTTLAALFLLTSNRKLWRCWHKAVNDQGINWAAGRNRDPGEHACFLEQAAISIACYGKPQVTLHDLTSSVDYPSESLRLIVRALWIARTDRDVITKIITFKKDGQAHVTTTH